MKKVIFPALLVAATLVFFSFKPMNKQVGTYDKVTGNIVLAPNIAKSFTESYRTGTGTDKTWSDYHRVWTLTGNSLDQADLLDKY